MEPWRPDEAHDDEEHESAYELLQRGQALLDRKHYAQAAIVAGGAGVDPAQDWLRFLTDGHQEGEYSMVGRDGRPVRLRYQARAHHPVPGYHLSRLSPAD